MVSKIGFLILVACGAAVVLAEVAQTQQDPVQAVLLGQKSFGKAKPLCKECEKFVTVLKKVVDNPEFEQELVENLKKVCNLPIFNNFKDICLNLVQDAIVVVHELQAYLDDPNAVCEILRLCDPEIPGLNLATKKFLLAVSAKALQDIHTTASTKVDTCDLCVSALNQLRKILETPEYMEKIENQIEKVCKYFGKYQKECDKFIEKVFPKVINAILEFLCQPIDTCTGIHLCKNQLPNAPMPFSRNGIQMGPHLTRVLKKLNTFQPNGIDFKCATCKTSIGLLLDYLKTDKVVTTIATDLTNAACGLFPKELQDGCYDFMGLYAKPSVVLTVNEWSPEDICIALHACKNHTMNQMQTLINNQALIDGQNGKLLCAVCKDLTKELASELENPQLQQDIISFLTQGCLYLPGKWGYKCQSFVATYIPYAITDILAESFVPHICPILHLC